MNIPDRARGFGRAMTSSGRSIARLAGLLRAGVARGETAAAAAASRAAHRAIVGSDRQRHHDLGRSFSSSSSSSSSSSEPSSTSKSGGENRHAEASSDRVGAGLRGDGTAPRFYKSVSVVPQKDAPGLWGIALDGKTLKTPSKAPLAVPSKALALAVAAEWEWQSGKSIRPFTMPLMALVATAMDQMSKPAIRAQHIHTLLEFFPTDVVLCRHEPSPLADYQAIAHEPVLRWARKELGDVTPTESIFGAEDIPEEVTRAAMKVRSPYTGPHTTAFAW